jgi:hypothetical protein
MLIKGKTEKLLVKQLKTCEKKMQELTARPRRPKIICSPSYADFRSNANTTRGLDFGHMMRREHTREV